MPAPVTRLRVPSGSVGCAHCAEPPALALPNTQRGTDALLHWGVITPQRGCSGHATWWLSVVDGEARTDVAVTLPCLVPVLPAIRSFADAVVAEDGKHAFVRRTDVKAVQQCGRLVRAGLPATQSTLVWALGGWTDRALIERAKAANMPEDIGYEWREQFGIEPEECLAWWSDPDHLNGDQVAAWVEVAVTTPQDRPAGLAAEDVGVLLTAQVTDRSPGWAGVGAACPHLVRHAVETGTAPADAVAVLSALFTGPVDDEDVCVHHEWECGWGAHGSIRAGALIRKHFEGLDWADVAMCLRAGMPPSEAGEHVRTGAEMDPVRLLAALGT